ncbi:HAD family hydrolase [Zobellella maritima]|uniref:HAD family hydrolase n=1 Tax=Zobellella maritima TaxID=2059725 RepID=UPI000E308B19|nr:HAD family hydrolase [Zobellella maritima]
MEIKGLLFDKDGTLLEFHQMWLKVAQGAASDILRQYRPMSGAGARVSEQQLLEAIGIWGDHVDNHGLLASNPVEDTAVAWYALLQLDGELLQFTRDVKACFNRQVEENPLLIQPLPGIRDKLIAWKQKGFKLGVATADTRDATLYSLRQAGLLELFDYVGYSDGDIAPKPDPALLRGFSERCGLEAHHIVMFGDTVSDMEFGHNAGARRVGVLTGTATADELTPHADLVLMSVVDFEPEILMQTSISEQADG